MEKFNVINYNVNQQKFEAYDVMPYLIECYKKEKKKPKTFEEFKDFIKDQSLYMYWGRCQYEIILTDWPCQKVEEKWDVYDQIMMNLDILTNLVMEECKKKKKNTLV